MKKKILLLLLFIILIPFVSCNKKETRFLLSGNINKEIVDLKSDDLKYKIEQEESFVLYIYLETCSSCLAFKNNVLQEYINESLAVLYSIEVNELDKEEYVNKPKYTLAPTISIIENGKAIKTLNYSSKDKKMNELNAFDKFLSEYVIKPNLITIDEETLDLKIANNESFVLYIGWYKCGDCKLLDSEILSSYLKSDKFKDKIYYLESDKYRSKKPSKIDENSSKEDKDNYQAWIDFATKYNFVSYRDGKIPTLQYYKNGVMEEMLVYHNDTINASGIVEISFFEELEGQSKTNADIIEYHNQKALEFLNKYYK